MADLLPVNFPPPAEPAAALYDYLDVISGIGYRNLYAGYSTHSGGTQNFFLTPNSTVSSSWATSGLRTFSSASSTPTEKNFDITFNVPARIGGDCIINFTVTNLDGDGSVAFTIYRVVGAAETSLGTVTSQSFAGVGHYRGCVKISLTDTSMKVSDILRLEAILTGTGASGSLLYIDPSSLLTKTETGGAGITINTDLIVKIPFIIRL